MGGKKRKTETPSEPLTEKTSKKAKQIPGSAPPPSTKNTRRAAATAAALAQTVRPSTRSRARVTVTPVEETAPQAPILIDVESEEESEGVEGDAGTGTGEEMMPSDSRTGTTAGTTEGAQAPGPAAPMVATVCQLEVSQSLKVFY